MAPSPISVKARRRKRKFGSHSWRSIRSSNPGSLQGAGQLINLNSSQREEAHMKSLDRALRWSRRCLPRPISDEELVTVTSKIFYAACLMHTLLSIASCAEFLGETAVGVWLFAHFYGRVLHSIVREHA